MKESSNKKHQYDYKSDSIERALLVITKKLLIAQQSIQKLQHNLKNHYKPFYSY